MADLPSVDSFFGGPAQPQGKPSVDEFFGSPQDQPVKSSAAIDQAMSQDTLGGPLNAIGHVLNAFGQGAKEGWGTAKVGELSPGTTDFMKKMGWFNDYKDGQSSHIKAINEAIVRPAAGTLSTVMRGFGAAFGGAEQAAAQAGVEVGQPEAGRTAAEIIEATSVGALHGVTGIPHAAEPIDLGQARSLRIIGDGEDGWAGTKVSEPATEAQRAEAMKPQVSAIQEQEPPAGAPETPTAAEVAPGAAPEPAKPQDIHEVARTIDPVTFDHYDALSARVDTFRRWITELDQTRREQAEANAPHTAEIADLKSRLADEDTTPRLRKKYEARLGDLQSQNDAAIAEATQGDSADMARVRGELQKADYAMRDLAPNVANAYRQAREVVPEETPAEAPVEQPVAEQPVAQAEPPLSPDHVRLYHSGSVGEGETGRWVSTNREYAANYRPDLPLHYLDIPKSDARVNNADIPDQGVGQGFTFNFELTPEEAAQLKQADREKAPEQVAQQKPAEAKSGPVNENTVQDIAGDVTNKLVAAGRPEEEAKAAAAIIQAHYETRAQRFGGAKGTAQELYTREGPEIRAAGQKAKRSLEMAQKNKTLHQEAIEPRAIEELEEKIKAENGLKSLNLRLRKNGDLVVDSIIVSRDQQGAGRGTAAMQSVTKYADENGLRTVLNAAVRDDGHGTTSHSRLVRFYKDLGFVENKGRKKDFSISEGMYREPASRILEQSKRGSISLNEGKNVIKLFKDADASTFMHETGHQWLEELMKDATEEAAPAGLISDAKSVRDWLGVKEGEEIATRQHEKFARGFERYLMEGVAPSQKLAGVFAQFKDWLTKIYQVVQRLRSPITDDIRDVYARLIEANPEKPVIGAERPVERTMADIHERDAEATPPEKAADAADNIRKEIDAIAREKAPEIHDELNPQPEAGGIAPENEGATGGGNAPGSATGDNGAVAESGTLTESRNEVAPESRPARGKPSSEQPAGPNADFGPTESPFIDKAGNIRLDNLNTKEEFNQVLRDFADQNEGFIAARRGVVTDQDMLDFADAMGVDASTINIQKLRDMSVEDDVPFSARILGGKMALIQSAKAVHEAMNGTDEVAYAIARERHLHIQETLSAITAEWGRGGRAFHRMKGETTEAENVSVFLEDTTGKTLFQIKQEMAKGKELSTPQQISKFIQDSKKPTFKDMLLEYWINALLSGPLTHMKNIMGNSLVAANSVIETALASGVGKILGSEDAVQMGEAKARWFGLTQGAIEGFQSAKAIVRSEEAIQGSHTVEVQRQAIPGVAGQIIRVPTRLLSAEDEVFKAIGFRQELNALAHRQAAKEGLTGDAFVSRMTDLVSNPSEEAMLQAKTNAEYQTFTNPLGPTGRAIQTFANSHPLAKFIVPFLRTPINIVKYAGERTPLGLVSREIRENLAGKNGTVARDTQIARLGLGTSLAAATVGLAAQGLITGGGPSDNAQKALMRAAGWQPYSIKIGDMYYSYQWAEPLASITGTVADIADIIHGSEAKGDDYDKVIGALIGGISKNLLGKLSLRGVSDFIQAAVDPTRYGQNYVQSFTGSFVPAIIAQAERTVDPTLRQARTTTDMLKSRIPGLSQTLLPKRDVWGEPIVNQGSLGPDIANPIYESKMQNDPVDRTLLQLGYYPSALKRNIRGVPLTDQQFDDYSRMAGRMAKMRLDAIVRTPGFSDTPAAIQAEIVAKTVDSARETARSVVMMQNSDIIRQAIAAKTAKLQRPQSVGAL